MSQSTDVRLIERWLPMAALSEECTRERRSMTALPPIYYLHVWWARRPLVASRAAILASLLPADADRERFLHAIGIHGDPVATRSAIESARVTGENLGPNPYGYRRAFTYLPTEADQSWIQDELGDGALGDLIVVDPTAGGGSIPLETERLGARSLANDLNPVAALLLDATVNWPLLGGVPDAFDRLAEDFVRRAKPYYEGVFPEEDPDTQVLGYLWARTITCPYCAGLVPLSPNWQLAPGGVGVHLVPEPRDGPGSAGRVCSFETVGSAAKQSNGTVARGDATCPFDDCGRVIDGNEIKRQAQAGQMGEQLYAIVFKRRVKTQTKTGRIRWKWQRGYRAPRPEDDNAEEIAARLTEKLPEW